VPKYKQSTYYGRKKSRWIAALVILLLAGGAAGLFVTNYVTISDDKLSVDFPPFITKMFRRAPPPPPPDDSIIIEFPSPSPEPTEMPPSVPRKPEQVRALFLPMQMLGDTAAIREISGRIPEDGVNMLMLEYKDTRGTVVNTEILTDALSLLRTPGLSMTAVISAGVDNTIPRSGTNSHWGLKVPHEGSVVNFVDGPIETGNRWLNLYMPEVREHIVSLALDAYGAGFDRVMLTHVGFPYAPGASRINYGDVDHPEDAVDAVNTLLLELRQAAGERPLDVWIFEETLADEEGIFEEAGQDLAAFTETFDLIYVSQTDDEAIDRPFIPILTADEAGMEDGTDRFVLIVR